MKAVNFETKVKNWETDRLKRMINIYQREIQAFDINDKIYQRYLDLTEDKRVGYEMLLEDLYNAKNYVDYLNSINPEYLQLYNAGMCEDYYNGSTREVAEAQIKVEEIQKQIHLIESEYPTLLTKHTRGVVWANSCNKKLIAIKNELSSRQENQQGLAQ